jgi:hypothetical protein
LTCTPWNPTGCASDIAKSVAGDAFSSIAHDFGNFANSAVNWVWAQTSNATGVHLGGAGFTLDIGIVATIAVTVALGLFVIQLMTAALRRDPAGLGRALKGLVVAFIGGGIAIAVTNVLLVAVDDLCAGVVQAATGGSITHLGQSILAGGSITTVTANPAGIILISLAALIAVTMVWAALMVRKVLIVVTAVFAPIAFAGSLADITTSWVRRWIELTVALIVSKLILVLIFVIGLGMLVNGVGQNGHGGPQTATQTISGLLVLVLAGFAPWLAIKLVHWSGEHFQQLHAMAGTAGAGAQKVMSAPQKARPLAMAVAGGPPGTGGAAAAGAASGASGQTGPPGHAGAAPSRANSAIIAGSANSAGSSPVAGAPDAAPSVGAPSVASIPGSPGPQPSRGSGRGPDALVADRAAALRADQPWTSDPSDGGRT